MVEVEKVESEKATEKIYRKLMVIDDMVEYVLEKYGRNWTIEDEIVDVILEDLQMKYGKWDDVELVDVDDVDLFVSFDLENKVSKLEEDFTKLLNAKKEKEAEKAELKVNKDVICFNDVKYPLTDDEIRMFKETPTTSRGPRRQLASSSIRSRALIASTSNA
ncbi:hypothetical protein Tco_0377847 [Tanacetum coccineum]